MSFPCHVEASPPFYFVKQRLVIQSEAGLNEVGNIDSCLSAATVPPCLSDLRSPLGIKCQLPCLVCPWIELINAEVERWGPCLCLTAGAQAWTFILCWLKQLLFIYFRASVGFTFKQQLHTKWKVIILEVPSLCSVNPFCYHSSELFPGVSF